MLGSFGTGGAVVGASGNPEGLGASSVGGGGKVLLGTGFGGVEVAVVALTVGCGGGLFGGLEECISCSTATSRQFLLTQT